MGMRRSGFDPNRWGRWWLAIGRSRRQWRPTVAAQGRIGGTACKRRQSRTWLARVCGDLGLSGGWVNSRRRCQDGNGMACSRARARPNWVSQGQRRGRCRVRRRAERLSRPGREKNHRLRVLVATIRSPRPLGRCRRRRSTPSGVGAALAQLANSTSPVPAAMASSGW